MVLLPAIDLLQHSLSNEVPKPVVVVVPVDDVNEVLVVASLDSAGDGDLRQDLLLRLRERGVRHGGNVSMRKSL